jgi:hypothetical protein
LKDNNFSKNKILALQRPARSLFNLKKAREREKVEGKVVREAAFYWGRKKYCFEDSGGN